ncbi:MAG: Flp family type IVb pilin [Sedimentisphaerales bacterium]|nr:Flp family type IVb pilin [Sedimentisphaerales bacterium]
MRTVLKRLVNDEKGLETVEYAIIAGLIVVGVIATIASIGTWVNTKFGELLTALSS